VTVEPVAFEAVALLLSLEVMFPGPDHATVPTAVSFAPVPGLLVCSPGGSLGEIEDDGETEGETDEDGEAEAEGDRDGDTEGETDEEPVAARGKAAMTPIPSRLTLVVQGPLSSVTAEPASR
jgi:hypothetical protein